MRIEYTLRYDATPDEVFEMLSQTPFREKVCKAQDAFECDVKITGGDDSMSVVVDQKRPSEGGLARPCQGLAALCTMLTFTSSVESLASAWARPS